MSALVEGLKDRTPMNDLEKQFRGKTLGKARERLMSAYSRFLLAENLAKSADTVGRNVLPAATVDGAARGTSQCRGGPAGCVRAGRFRPR